MADGAQRAAKRDGLGAYLRALWPASALGLLTAVLTPSPTGLAAGIVWTLSPFVLAALGAPNTPGAAPLQHAAQRELLGWAKATWQYFETSHRRGALTAAGQCETQPADRHGAPHIADEHGLCALVRALRTRAGH